MSKSSSENTQGARLNKAQDVAFHIQNFVNFNPPSVDDQASNFAAAVMEFENSVVNFTLAEQQYRLATEYRQNIFKDNEFSAVKILKYVRAIAEVHFGLESRQFAIIMGAVQAIRPSNKSKKKEEKAEEETEETDGMATDDVTDVVADDAIADEEESDEKEEPRKVSQSHRSYASMALSFRKIVELMATIPYQSNTPALQIGALQQLAQDLSQANRTVAQSLSLMENNFRRNKQLDEQISASVTRIKSYVKYAYGVNSTEYLTIK